MSSKGPRRKHVPCRTCVACRAVRAKRELVRVVRTPEGAAVVDERGKMNGRGAYLCAQRTCWLDALSRRRLDQALRMALDDQTAAVFRAYADRLPETLGQPEEDGDSLAVD